MNIKVKHRVYGVTPPVDGADGKELADRLDTEPLDRQA
jgi:hypothetical protein